MDTALLLLSVGQLPPESFNGSIREMIIHASPMAKIVLIILLLFSVFAWAIIIDKYRTYKKVERENSSFLELFRRHVGSFDTIYQQSMQYQFSPLARIFRSGYRQLLAEKESREQKKSTPDKADASPPSEGEIERLRVVLDQASREEISFLEGFLTFLATTGAVSPFIGLFGTVWGIMNSFRGLGIQGSASIGAVAPGIAEALVATAAGLAAAIPAVMAYNHFFRRLNSVINSLSDFTREFLGRIIP